MFIFKIRTYAVLLSIVFSFFQKLMVKSLILLQPVSLSMIL